MENTSTLSSLRPSFRKSNSNKVEYLYEIDYVSDESKVPITQLPLLNPYKAFTKPNTIFPKVIRYAFGPSKSMAKELVLASQLEQHLIPATEAEQMIPLRLEEGMIHQWRHNGYTHLHYGAIRLALTLLGRKGLPVVARLALLDTRYREYQHAYVATIQTTLNAGTVFVTLFPNFNIALEDPQIYQNMQIQLQITGAPQVGNTYVATLHHQMAYRVQNHAMDLSLPRDSEDALFIHLESQNNPSCIHIPRDELIKLLPESWITNYEKIHERSVSIQSIDSSIQRKKDGTIEIAFKQQREEKPRPSSFCTEINMISKIEEEVKYLRGVPIVKFNPKGEPIFAFDDKEGHKFFDVCDCEKCLWPSLDEEDVPRRGRKKKSENQRLKERYEAGDPEVGLLGESSGKYDFYVLYPRRKKEEAKPIYMIGPSGSQDPFPSKEFEQDNIRRSWKVKNPNTRNPDGTTKQVSAAEATLNWQSENAIAQNHMLKQVDTKVSVLDSSIQEINRRITTLHQELLHLATTVSMGNTLMYQKEQELKNLRNQLHSITSQPYRPQAPMPQDIFMPYPMYVPPYVSQSQPLSFQGDPSIFGASSFLPTRIMEEQHVT